MNGIINSVGSESGIIGAVPVNTQCLVDYKLTSYPSGVTGNDAQYTIVCDTKNHDVGNNYNTSTGAFVTPVNGIYHFNCYLESRFHASTTVYSPSIVVGSTSYSSGLQLSSGAVTSNDDIVGGPVTRIIKIPASTTCYMKLTVQGAGSNLTQVRAGTSFCVYLISTY
jgi:hypothetical protein